MSEVFGYILLTLVLIVFGGLFVVMAIQSIFFSSLENFVRVLTKLGFAAIVPSGMYALLKLQNQKEKDGEQRVDGAEGQAPPRSTDS